MQSFNTRLTSGYVSRISQRQSSNWNRNQNTIRHKPRLTLGPVSHTVFIVGAIVVLGMIYLTQAAKITNYDYEAERIDAEISELASKKEDLAIENARLTALNAISSTDVAKNMVEPSSTGYVNQ